MRNLHIFAKIGITLFSLSLFGVAWIAIVTHTNRNISNPNPFIYYAIQNNVIILIILIAMSVAYGFVWSSILYREVKQKKQESKSILETVFLFLGNEEKNIIEFLVKKKGNTTQAEISKLSGMTRLKAFRALQKMQNKNLVEIVPHGKLRIVKLKQNVLNVLLE